MSRRNKMFVVTFRSVIQPENTNKKVRTKNILLSEGFFIYNFSGNIRNIQFIAERNRR